MITKVTRVTGDRAFRLTTTALYRAVRPTHRLHTPSARPLACVQDTEWSATGSNEEQMRWNMPTCVNCLGLHKNKHDAPQPHQPQHSTPNRQHVRTLPLTSNHVNRNSAPTLRTRRQSPLEAAQTRIVPSCKFSRETQ